MSAIRGTWKGGRIVLDEPVDWPEGHRVRVEPAEPFEKIELREEDWSDTPEAIADWLQWYDSLEPLEMTPEEEQDLAAWRKKVKKHTIANSERDIKGLFE